MKLSEYKKKGEENTSKASEITRQLAFAGIVIVWIFHSSQNSLTSLPSFLIFPLIGFSFTLLFDLLQYIVAGVTWRRFYKKKEREVLELYKKSSANPIDPETKHPRKMNRPIEAFYLLKIISLVFSFILLIIFLLLEINFTN